MSIAVELVDVRTGKSVVRVEPFESVRAAIGFVELRWRRWETSYLVPALRLLRKK